MNLDGFPSQIPDRREGVGRLLIVRIAVDPSMEAMSETSCFAHSVQQASDPLRVFKKLRRMTGESVLAIAVDACNELLVGSDAGSARRVLESAKPVSFLGFAQIGLPFS